MVEVGGKLKAGYTIHGHRDRAIVSSVKQRNSHSVLVRPRWSLAAVYNYVYHMQPY